MEYVYGITKEKAPGFMFIYAAALYAIGTVIVSMISAVPRISEIMEEPRQGSENGTDGDLEEPLLTTTYNDHSS
jgi:hypothetical protein